MKPSKMIRHLDTTHPAVKDKPVDFFQRKLAGLQNQQVSISNLSDINENALKASYQVALLIAKERKAHTIGERLILPSAIKMVETMIGHDEAQKLKKKTVIK